MNDRFTPLTRALEKASLLACAYTLRVFFHQKLRQTGFFTAEYQIRKQYFEEAALTILKADRIRFLPEGLYDGPAELQVEIFQPFVKDEGWRPFASMVAPEAHHE